MEDPKSGRIAVVFLKCDHVGQARVISKYSSESSVYDVFKDFHPVLDDKQHLVTCMGSASKINKKKKKKSTYLPTLFVFDMPP